MMGESVCAVGMESDSNWVSGRAAERQRGALQILQPGEQRRYHLEIGVLASQAAITKIQTQ